ncbi:MAG: respiratory nitrate reductase subunit gamma [Deltaproteobacteria bacterium]|nr:respiratory nitrate reductase subunit gamma [Deltaproteobacteria bacterium]
MTEFFFGSFPYAAVLLAVAAGVGRYVSDRFSFTSHSTQFLENRWLFWGSVSWHYGITIVLLAHILAALFPGAWGILVGEPSRLFMLEATGLALGLLALFGCGALVARRLLHPRLAAVTTAMEWIILLVLFLQVASGVYIAWGYRWGAAWYLHTAVPWLGSLVRLSPETAYIAQLPGIVKFHIINAFVLVALLPFTRLVHLFTVPVSYVWRPYLLFFWNRKGPHPEREGE